MSQKLKEQVSAFILRHHLLDKKGRYVVALSGGADSVCLLLLLRQLGYRIEAAHCNFHLRGAESDRDEAFVAALCSEHHIPLHRIHFDTKTYATLHHVSIEMAARELRYQWFEQLLKDMPADAVCVAHHRDDSVETVLLNLIRGTGIKGLCGIQPRHGNIVRPLLCVSRQAIEVWLQGEGQDYVTDSTNLVPDVHRNQIRLQVLPLLQQINPSVAEAIQLTANRLADVNAIYDTAVIAQKKHCIKTLSEGMISIDTAQLTHESILYEILKDYHFTPLQVQQIYDHLDAQVGCLYRSLTHELCVDRHHLVVAPIFQPSAPFRIPETGNYVYQLVASTAASTAASTSMPITRTFHVTSKQEVTISKSPFCMTVDAAQVTFPLTVRPIASGDRFQPFGMKGTQLISDYLTDRKLSYVEKVRQLVLVDGSGEILWLVGQRVAAPFAVTTSTQSVLEIRVSTDS